jgi:hypothetical protein
MRERGSEIRSRKFMGWCPHAEHVPLYIYPQPVIINDLAAGNGALITLTATENLVSVQIPLYCGGGGEARGTSVF